MNSPANTSEEKMVLKDRTTYDDQLFTSEERENSGQNSKTKCNCSPFSKRYIISVLALLGFANVYALRVNLSVALVAMVTKTSTLNEEGKMVKVQMPKFNFVTNRGGSLKMNIFPQSLLAKTPRHKSPPRCPSSKSWFLSQKVTRSIVSPLEQDKSLSLS